MSLCIDHVLSFPLSIFSLFSFVLMLREWQSSATLHVSSDGSSNEEGSAKVNKYCWKDALKNSSKWENGIITRKGYKNYYVRMRYKLNLPVFVNMQACSSCRAIFNGDGVQLGCSTVSTTAAPGITVWARKLGLHVVFKYLNMLKKPSPASFRVWGTQSRAASLYGTNDISECALNLKLSVKH